MCVCARVCVWGGGGEGGAMYLYTQKCYISKIPHYANMYFFIDLEDLVVLSKFEVFNTCTNDYDQNLTQIFSCLHQAY